MTMSTERQGDHHDTEVLLRRVLDLVNGAPKMPLSSTVRLEKDEVVELCRVDANEKVPFACPEGCLFFEPRAVSDAGWHQAPPRPDR